MNAPARKVGANGITGAQGHPGGAALPEGFTFRCIGHSYRAWVQDDRHGFGVYAACDVGILPYSAENRDARRSALLLLSRAGSLGRSRLMLTDFHKISVVTRAPLADSSDTIAIVAAATHAAIGGTPLVQLMSNCLAVPPAGNA